MAESTQNLEEQQIVKEEQSQSKRLEPWEELSPDALKKVNALTEAAFQATNTIEVNLATDPIKVPGQNWACVSFVSPDSTQKSKAIGMKIRGVFDTRDEAIDHVKRLIRLDPMFDIFVCDMYNWCLVPPDPEMVGDQTYQDETLNTIIGEYRKNQIYAKEHFEERKREMMEQAADELKRAALKKLEEEKEEEAKREAQAEAERLEFESLTEEEKMERISKKSQEELEKSQQEHVSIIQPEDRFTDVTEIEGIASNVGTFGETPKGFVTASELMESMMGEGKCKETE